MKLNPLAVVLAALVVSLPAVAQDVVGTSVINGRTVQLMSDFSWKYVSDTPAACQVIQDNVSFCGRNSGWTPTPGSGDGVMFRLNDHTYGKIIVEELGSDDGVTEQVMTNAVIQNAASAAKVEPKEIVAFGSEEAVLDGISGRSLDYNAKIDNLPVVFENTMFVQKHQSVQIITFDIGGNITDAMKAHHKAFLAVTHLR